MVCSFSKFSAMAAYAAAALVSIGLAAAQFDSVGLTSFEAVVSATMLSSIGTLAAKSFYNLLKSCFEKKWEKALSQREKEDKELEKRVLAQRTL